MAKRTVITNKGLELLASSSEATGQYWWIGYYGLAYVPNFWKEDTEIEMPDEDDICDRVNSASGFEISTSDIDPVVPSMTRLTKYGDMIYNVFQGDLVGTGYYDCVSDGSVGGDLFGLTMYNTNIKKHYRYVLNEYGNNTLVTWVDLPTDEEVSTDAESLMKGKYIYLGTDGYSYSDIPIPAPLYYMGNTGNTATSDFFPNFNNEVYNGASIYPYITVSTDASTTINVPLVSVDYREYVDSQGNGGKETGGGLEEYPYNASSPANLTDPTNFVDGAAGDYFGTYDVPATVDTEFDSTSWYAADLTFRVYDSGSEATICNEFWKMLSISNYNLFHAPTGSTGHILSSDLSNRNMAKVTKFFPISSYKVINTEAGVTTSGESVEVASAISVRIDLDLAPRIKGSGYDDSCDFDEEANLSFFDKYNLSDKDETQQTQPYYGATATINDQLGSNIFDTTHTSFKFNRIGLYAVPLRKCPFVKDTSDPVGEDVIVEFDINPDVEPILFAVVDWDNTITLDDTGNGIHQFNAEFNLNLASGNLDADALARSTAIYYNLYEDDALTWYQNQLVANASTQHAITEVGLEVQNIKARQGSGGCPPPDLSKKYSPLNHSHRFTNNIRDGLTSGSMRGTNTIPENTQITIAKDYNQTTQEDAVENYALHENTTVFGKGNKVHASPNSTITNGLNSTIYDSLRSGIVAGELNVIGDVGSKSIIGAGISNRIASGENSLIGAGNTNRIMPFTDGTISSNSTIMGGKTNDMIAANESIIGAGTTNIIRSITSDVGEEFSINSGIFTGYLNVIEGGYTSVIGGGKSNRITDTPSSEIGYNAILGGMGNYMNGVDKCAIVGGSGNFMSEGAVHGTILGGNGNDISQNVVHGTILGGLSNQVIGDYGTVTGMLGMASNPGELVHASGALNIRGDAQHSTVILSGKSLGSTPKTLKLNGNDFFNLDTAFEGYYGAFSGTIKLTGHGSPVIWPLWKLTGGGNPPRAYIEWDAGAVYTFIPGETIIIAGSTNYDGTYTVYEDEGDGVIVFNSGISPATETGAGITLTTQSCSCIEMIQFSGYYNGTDGNKRSFLTSDKIGDSLVTGFTRMALAPGSTTGLGTVSVTNEKLIVTATPVFPTTFTTSLPINWVAEIDMVITKMDEIPITIPAP